MPQPQSSLIERLLATMRPDPLPQNVEEGKKVLAAEAPDINTTPISSYGPISKALLPGAEGYVSPLGTIYLNQELMKGKQPQEVADTLLHELTHVRQANARSPVQRILEYFRQQGPYGQRPDEMEAFQAEADRRTNMGRAPIYGTPHFLDDTQETRGNIRLMSPIGKK